MRERPCRRASPGGVNAPLPVEAALGRHWGMNPPLPAASGGINPPLRVPGKWLDDMRKAPAGPVNPPPVCSVRWSRFTGPKSGPGRINRAWHFILPNAAVSDCAFCAFSYGLPGLQREVDEKAGRGCGDRTHLRCFTGSPRPRRVTSRTGGEPRGSQTLVSRCCRPDPSSEDQLGAAETRRPQRELNPRLWLERPPSSAS